MSATSSKKAERDPGGRMGEVNLFKHNDLSSEDQAPKLSSPEAFESALNQFKDTVFTSAYDYIEKLSRKTVLQQEKANASAIEEDKIFGLEPLEAVFKKKFTQLSELHLYTNKKVLSLSKECATMEEVFKKKMDDLSVKSDLIFKNFSDYDSLISKIANSVRGIGGSLESIESKRSKAIETRIYINYIFELNKKKASIDEIFKDISDFEKAILIRNLLTLTEEMNVERSSIARKNIEKAAERLEHLKLEQFVKAIVDMKYDVMKESSKVLFELNGSDECIKYYINRLDIFFEEDFAEDEEVKDVAVDDEKDKSGFKGDQAVDFPRMASTIDSFYTRILKVVKGEVDMILNVFPVPSIVLQKLVRRLFEQKISSFLGSLLYRCSKDLDLKLKVLYHALKQIKLLMKEFSAAPISISMDMLNSLTDFVFERSKDDYIHLEMQSMTEFYDREKAELMGPKSGELSAANRQGCSIELPVDLTVRCMERAEEAVERCQVLSNTNSLASNIYLTFEILLNRFGRDILLNYLKQATKQLSLNSDLEVIRKYLFLIQTVNTNVVLLRKYCFIRVRPHVEGHKKEQGLYREGSGDLFAVLEREIGAGLDRVMRCQLSLIQKTLASLQKKGDYWPKDDQSVNLKYPTKACEVTCRYIRSHHETSRNCLDGRNIQTYMYAFGMKLLSLLLKHIRKFRVESGVGGMSLMRDVSEYQECVCLFGIEKLNYEFQILNHIAKLHLVNPDRINEVVSSSEQLSKLSKGDLECFIKMRGD